MSNVKATRIVMSTVAVVALGLHLRYGWLRLDGVSWGLIALALLPWLGEIIKSIEVPGFGKIELQQLRDDVAVAKGAAESADQKADLALATPMMPQNLIPGAGIVASPSLDELARRYNDLRTKMASSDERTLEMTQIVSAMIGQARAEPSLDVESALISADAGVRLTGFARLYAMPDARFVRDLVATVTRIEDKPFGQFWGLLALRRVLEGSAGLANRADIHSQMRSYYLSVPSGSDRGREARRILEILEHQSLNGG